MMLKVITLQCLTIQYKLTVESDPDVDEPSERIIDKSVFQILFDDESKTIRKHLFDISTFKMQLVKVNEGSVPESEVDGYENLQFLIKLVL